MGQAPQAVPEGIDTCLNFPREFWWALPTSSLFPQVPASFLRVMAWAGSSIPFCLHIDPWRFYLQYPLPFQAPLQPIGVCGLIDGVLREEGFGRPGRGRFACVRLVSE